MTDLAALPASPQRVARPGRVAWLAGSLAAATLGGILLGRAWGAGPAGMEHPLVLLLRFMAVCKGAMALGAAALVAWRLRRPLAAPAFAGYLAALALMAAAPGLVWSLGAIAPGALLFHAGLVAFLVLAVRDDEVARSVRPRRG